MASAHRLLTLPLIASAALTSACMDLVEIEVLRPAEVQFPEDIQTILVIDRAGPKNFGEELLAGVEGLGSAEGLLADKEAREAAISSMKEGLRDSPRFNVIDASIHTQEYSTSIWDISMPAWEVIDLCIAVQCDGIVSLDAFDSDTSVTEVIELAESMDGEKDARKDHFAIQHHGATMCRYP